MYNVWHFDLFTLKSFLGGIKIFFSGQRVIWTYKSTVHEFIFSGHGKMISKYSEIPLLRPLKIRTAYLLKTLFAKFKLFFSSFSTPSVHLIRDHLWDCSKVVFKTTFGQSQRWSYYRNFSVYFNDLLWNTDSISHTQTKKVSIF